MAQPTADPKVFVADITAFVEKTKGKLEALARQSIQQVCANVVIDTPVDTGFLRASWQPALNEPAPGAASSGLDKTGAATQAKIVAMLTGLRMGDTFYMTNGAAYALRQEYGFVGEDSLGRYYNQAGRFFVTGNVMRWPQVVSDVAKELAA